jgi:trk system potassium uptake protein TrkA
MKKQFAVIGLGNFGFYLASGLSQKGHEVLGIDINPRQVQEIRDQVSRAVIADATDPQALRELELEKMDAVVVSIGSILNNSILATLNVKDMGVKRVVAKAVSEAHGRIFRKSGPTKSISLKKISPRPRLSDWTTPMYSTTCPLMEGYSIVQLAPPREFIGKTLIELDLINKYGIQVVAVKELVPENVVLIPTGRYLVKDSDILILLGPDDALAGLKG